MNVRAVLRNAADRYYLARCRLRRRGAFRYLFILGHMRSGSTLLTHLLASNRDVIGFGETFLSYASRQDLACLICTAYRAHRRIRMHEKYVLDKILHNGLTIGDEILRSKDCYFIFLIREPIGAVASMVKAFPDWFTGETLDSETVRSNALEHYMGRLAQLCKYAETIACKERTLLLSHSQLENDTTTTFKKLEAMLDLREPLTERYTVTRTTGRRGGDPSPNILLGYIDRNRPKPDAQHVARIPDEALAAFEHASSVIAQCCGS